MAAVARDAQMLQCVVRYEVAPCVAVARLAVVEKRIGRRGTSATHCDRAIVEPRLLRLGVDRAEVGVERSRIIHDARRTQNPNVIGQKTVFQRVAVERHARRVVFALHIGIGGTRRDLRKVVVAHHHIALEDGEFALRVIRAEVAQQVIFGIVNPAAVRIVRPALLPVIQHIFRVQARVVVNHQDVVVQLANHRLAIVRQRIAPHLKRVALPEMHVAECLERVTALVEIGAVARHPNAVLTEQNIAAQHLPLLIDAFVERHGVGVL